MEIIGVIVAGIIIGLLGKFVAPGDKDNIPIWLTILCGIGGVVLGCSSTRRRSTGERPTVSTGCAGSWRSSSRPCWSSSLPRSPEGTKSKLV